MATDPISAALITGIGPYGLGVAAVASAVVLLYLGIKGASWVKRAMGG